jgi:hypothetical protein
MAVVGSVKQIERRMLGTPFYIEAFAKAFINRK